MYDLKVVPGAVEGVKIWPHKIFEDSRGKLIKAHVFDSPEFASVPFHTFEHFFTLSGLNVFRGMHLQSGIHSSSKIVSLVIGSATDFLLDLRSDSPTFGKLQIEEISGDSSKSVYIPTGVAHGYISRSENTIFSYRYETFFCPKCDSGINPKIIQNFINGDLQNLILSQRDMNLTTNVDEANHIRGHE